MDTLSQPVINIMRTGEWKDAHAFRVACDCHSNQHDLDVWVEVVPELDCDDITVTFYKDIYVPFWKSGYNRILEAWRVLFTGHATRQGDFIMDRATARQLCSAIEHSIQDLEHKKSN
jgi:hypothetical protein